MKFIYEYLSKKKQSESDIMVFAITSQNENIKHCFVSKDFNKICRAAVEHDYLIKNISKDIFILYKKNESNLGSLNVKGYRYNLPVVLLKQQKETIKKFLYTDNMEIRKMLR